MSNFCFNVRFHYITISMCRLLGCAGDYHDYDMSSMSITKLHAPPRNHPKCCCAGDSCSPCPPGSVCPGGSRAWPLPGYWTPSEASALVLRCPYPSVERCVGWDSASKSVVCGDKYAPLSVGCGACATGHYAADDGTCEACPTGNSASWTKLAPALFFFGSLAIGAIGLIIVVLILAHCNVCISRILKRGVVRRPQVQLLFNRLQSLLIWLFMVLQVQMQVANAAGPGLPQFLRELYSRLNLFSFSGLGLPAA